MPGESPSRVLVHVRMRQYRRGKVGTNRDYDFALKGLIPIVCRYRAIWTDKEVELIVRDLFPKTCSASTILPWRSRCQCWASTFPRPRIIC